MSSVRVVFASEADYEDGVRCVVMPCCGFTFDAVHLDDRVEPERYSCPLCSGEPELGFVPGDRSCGLSEGCVREDGHQGYCRGATQTHVGRIVEKRDRTPLVIDEDGSPRPVPALDPEETVARALFDVEMQGKFKWDDEDTELRDYWLTAARAAITAYLSAEGSDRP